MKVRILRDALAVMIANTVEVYKRESYGTLVGEKHNGSVIVRNAVPFQAVKLKFSEVETISDRAGRLEQALETIGLGRVVGDYHSHPSHGDNFYPPEPSNTDLESMLASDLPAHIILSIHDKKRTMPWHYCTDGRLAGSVNGYWIDIAAYFKTNDEEFKRTRIVCPYAIRKKLT